MRDHGTGDILGRTVLQSIQTFLLFRCKLVLIFCGIELFSKPKHNVHQQYIGPL